LPEISVFLQFWEKYITISEYDFHQYELDELNTLFKTTQNTNTNIREEDILKIIKHFFYPYVEIVDDKYIMNIKCSLWDKCIDIEQFLQHYKQIEIHNKTETFISFDELYTNYQIYCHANNCVNQSETTCMIVSKHYFEKYLQKQLSEYIQFESFVSREWIESL
jgi:hypothetical protein